LAVTALQETPVLPYLAAESVTRVLAYFSPNEQKTKILCLVFLPRQDEAFKFNFEKICDNPPVAYFTLSSSLTQTTLFSFFVTFKF
jgi:hypothetical protein